VRRLHHPVALLLRTAAPRTHRIGRWVGQQPICTLKFTQEQITKVQRASRGITTLSLTSVLEGVGGQCHAPAALPPGGRLSGSQGRSRRMQNISPPTGIRSLDRPARSMWLYRLRYPGPRRSEHCASHANTLSLGRQSNNQPSHFKPTVLPQVWRRLRVCRSKNGQ